MHGAQRSAPRRDKDRLLLKNSSNGAINAPFLLSLMKVKTDAETHCFGAESK